MPTTLTADQNGVITGKFTIPASTFKAGTKQVRFQGAGLPAVGNTPAQPASHAETTFTGQGTVVTNTMRQVTNVMQSYYDPLAQTFILNDPRQLHGVDVFLMVAGTTDLIVQLRETSVGFPTRSVLAEGHIKPSDANYQTNQWVTVKFDKPYYVSANVEYAVVVLANDATTAVGISELGKKTIDNTGYVTAQPYQIGVLLSSSNASTWTAHQDKDLSFRLRARTYNKLPRLGIPLGQFTLKKDTTDLLVSAITTTPATGADAVLHLTLPAGGGRKSDVKYDVSDGQVIQLAEPIDADTTVTVTADLRCTSNGFASATIAPGTQFVLGQMAMTGQYISKDIPVVPATNVSGGNNTYILTCTLDTDSLGVIPVVDYCLWPQTVADGQAWIADNSHWHNLPQDTIQSDSTVENGSARLVFANTVGVAIPDKVVKLRITLTTTATDMRRPKLFNLRLAVVSK
ncbi:hypothetical protein ZL58_14430 [Salmonella enterica subsp. enterica serovar Typhimurium]|nr:hypothetical protein [Salmonella enterica subsp. enterica serovar Typhimurium]